MNAQELSKILLENPNFEVFHDDCENGLSEAKLEQIIVIQDFYIRNNEITEYNRPRAIKLSDMEDIHSVLANYEDHLLNIEQRHAEAKAEDQITIEKLIAENAPAADIEIWRGMTPEFEHFKQIFVDMLANQKELIRRIAEDGKQSFVISW